MSTGTGSTAPTGASAGQGERRDDVDARFEGLFRQMLRIRRVEERVIELYPSDRVQSPVHLSIGQEGVAVGVCDALRSDEPLFANYRGHSWYLAKGGGMPAMFAELFGRATGVAGGKAGSMHLAAPDSGFMGSSAVVASTIPHAVGAALAARLRGRDQVVTAVFGDGATEEGVYHEALNFAALRRVPVLLVCENNRLACHSRLEARQAFRIAEQASSYGIPVTRWENGNDVVGLAGLSRELVASVRGQGGPHFIEVETCRYREHVGPGEDFDAGYRLREERATWEAGDPMAQRPDLVERFDPEIRSEIDAAVAFAEQSPAPGPSDLLTDVI